jgi:proteasome accessory factor C
VQRPAAGIHDDTDLVYRPAPDDLRVRLLLSRDAAWVAESIPVESRRARRGGKTEVVLAVSGPAFLERLVLSLGPAATVLGPDEARAAVAGAAGRVLSRYREEPRSGGRPETDAAGVEV